MSHEIATSGVAISVISTFVRWAFPVVPKPVAWSGVIAGFVVLVADGLLPQMNITLPAIGLFLVGVLCIAGAVNMSLHPKPTEEGPGAAATTTNRIGDVTNNSGVVTQGQRGDNAIGPK
jgi:hypothetical protein